MKTQQKLTEAQLDEIRELAKTKTLKEIASHFNMSKTTFLMIRKLQPEIDAIYQGAAKSTVPIIYTPEQLLEIEKKVETLPMTSVAEYLGISMPTLGKARKGQPELEESLVRGINNRASNFNHLMLVQKNLQKSERAKIEKQKLEEGGEAKGGVEKKGQEREIKLESTESLFTRAPDDISPEEAIMRFRKLKAVDKNYMQLQELKEINLTYKLFKKGRFWTDLSTMSIN